jgi:hypothetical protein
MNLKSLEATFSAEVAAVEAFTSLSPIEVQAYFKANPTSILTSALHLHLKKGALHRDLGVPSDQPLTDAELKRGEHSRNPKTRKRAYLADTMRHKWKHK